MADTGSLKNDKLFKGLTRPPTFGGVSMSFCLANIMCNMFVFILTKRVLILLIVLPAIHMVGYIICFKEPLFVEIYQVRLKYFNKCRNRFYHGSNSYDVR